MKKPIAILLVALALFAGAFTQTLNAQVTVAGSAGSADGTYTTLKGAFDALNWVTKTQTGKTIVVTITASTTETAAAVLNPPQIGAWTSFTIYPTSTGLSISGTVDGAPLIDLNGADNVTIDGRVNQAGAKNLLISNASISATVGTSTIRFINDATNNTVKYCMLKGSETATTGGILFFSTGTLIGNDNNTIDNNDITNCTDANRPKFALYSYGTFGAENSGITISNNNIYDFLNRGIASFGIYLSIYTTSCTISGNSFYETTSFVPTATGNYYTIYISYSSGINFTVSNNNIGGSNASCGGVNAWRKTNAFGNTFYGIYLVVGTATASNVQGNTIANFDYSNSGSSSWYGIYAQGNVNIGTTTGNLIGNATTTGSIKYSCSLSGGNFYGINLNNFSGIAQNNTIASITVSNTDATMATNFTGINMAGSLPCTVSNNTIGNTSVANSINASSAATANAQTVYGIISSATGSVTIAGNTIANLTNGTTNGTAGTAGLINGIYVSAGSNVITNNVVRDLTIANANNLATYQASVSAFVFNNASAGQVQTIAGNTIYNLSNTYTSFAGTVTGMYYAGSKTPATVSGNFIYNLSVTGANSTTAILMGIQINSGTTTYTNNIINLGGNTKTTIYGIIETGTAGTTNNLYFNTVYIGGTLASGSTNKSQCLISTSASNTRDFRNNIFHNARSTTGGSSLHYAMYISTTGGTLNCDNNDYFVSGTGSKLGFYGADKAALPIVTGVTGNDANSKSIIPSFAVAGGTSALNYYPSASLPGIAGTGVLADYSNYTRAATPKMGAVEFDSAPASGGNTVAVYNGPTLLASYLSIHDAFDKINDGTHSGNIIIKINASQLLSASAVLNASGTGTLPNISNYTSVNIFPTATGLSISGNGNFTDPLIDLNGSDNVTIDGRVNGTGSTKSLTISNPGMAGATIRFVNDAVGNTVKYCTVKGSSTDPNGGILLFSTTNGTTGNDNNVIDNNDITNAADANRPVNAVFSLGTGIGTENSENTITNNNIYDFLNRGIASYGINLSNNTTAWTISGNSFYETASFVPTGSVEYRVINTSAGQNFTVSNNFIGGTTALCGGTAWTKTNAFANAFYGISISAGTTIASNVQGNILKNMAYANASASGNWVGIYVSGMVNVGTTAGNTIGAATGNGSITYTSGYSGSSLFGLYIDAQVIAQNNNIGAITVANSNSASATNFYGIYIYYSSIVINIKNNVIGSTDAGTTNSIYASSASTANAQTVYGIYGTSSGSVTIAGNTIAKMTNGTTNSTGATTGLINGIYVGAGSNSMTNNVVRDLTISNANYSQNYQSSVGGIVLNTTSANFQTITGNTISGLSNTYPTYNGAEFGIYYSGGTTASWVSGNFIYGLSLNAGSTAAMMYGIITVAGATTYSNNIINLGGNTLTTIVGIYEGGTANNNNNLFFNTVYISGTLPSGSSNKSYCLSSGASTNIRDFRNNIFCNVRSTTGAVTGLHYAVRFNYAVSTGLTLANNDYYAPGTGGFLGYYNAANVTSIPLIAGIDANSLAINPSFAVAGGTSVLNYYPSASLPGIAGTGTLTDFNEYFRNAVVPKMGALESTSPGNAVDLYVGGTLQSSFKNITAAFDKINNGTYTGAIVLKIKESQELTTTAVLNASGIGSANYTLLTMYPTVTGLTISGNIAAPLIDLNGADNVTIDGRVNATGTAKDLTITNTSISSQTGTSTIRFINGATNNAVQYCTIKGSSMATTGGIVYFATTSGTIGNDNNLIDNDDITNAADANRPLNVVYSLGLVGTENSNNTISNNNIFDFLNRGTASYGVNIGAGSTGWTISGNSFYETTLFVPTASVQYSVINYTASAGQNFTVSNNSIGGSAPNCGGPAWTKSNAFDNAFYAINMNVGTSTASNVQGNTIQNFVFSNSLNGSWYGINCSSGNVNIGTTAGNVIGSSTGNGSITLTNSTSAGFVYGIYLLSTGTADNRNNTIGSITAANTDATAATNICGIYKNSTGTATISNNTIGSTDSGTSNSLNATSLSTSDSQIVYGISNSGGAVTVRSNTISKLMNGKTNGFGRLYGISNDSSIGSTISNNFINTLLVNGPTSATVFGILSSYGIATYSNNIISLGGSTATMYGIYETGAAGSENDFYYNTVYLGGSLGAGVTNKSYALYSNSSSNNCDFRNNIFCNARSTTGGYSLHYAAYFNYTTSANLTLANNDYYAPGTGGMLGNYNNTSVSSLPLIAGMDANSLAINPSFASAGGTAAENYLPSESTLVAATGTGIVSDYDGGAARNVTYPAMGAYEYTVSPTFVWNGSVSTNWNTAANWSVNAVPTATDNAQIPHVTNDPIVNEAAATPAVCKNLTIESGAVLTIAAGKALTVNGTLTNHAGITGVLVQSTSGAFDGTGALINSTAGVLGTVERFVSGDLWHLISPAATAGETVASFVDLANGNLVARNSTNYALAPWLEATGKWDYYKVAGSNTSGLFGTPAKGFQVMRSSGAGTGKGTNGGSGKLTFKGTLAATDLNIAATKSGYGWNLIGNPYPCALDVTKFITANTPLLDQSYVAIYVSNIGDVDVKGYSPVIATAGLKLAPGEGFFVRTKTGGGTINFTADMKSNVADAFKAATIDCPTVQLTAEDGNGKFGTTVKYESSATKGLDPGKDAGLFNGTASTFSLFTRLVEDNGVDFTIQALPDNNLENMVVPVGLVADKGATVTFKATAANLPTGYKVYLEDRELGTFTRLDEVGNFYSVALNAASNGTGRFYLHTSEIVSAIDESLLNEFKVIPNPEQHLVRIVGNFDLPAKAMVYDMNGKLVATSMLTSRIENDIPLSNSGTGVYLLRTESGKGVETVKFVWKRK